MVKIACLGSRPDIPGLHWTDGDDWDFRLSRPDTHWRLENREDWTLEIDFDRPGPDYYRAAPRGRQELLARALGSRQKLRRVLDLSAGLGQDAVFLSQLGFSVTAVERHPLLAFLLIEARRASPRADLKELNFTAGDARAVLSEKATEFDAAYFDPMYPTKTKSALPRQEMRLFRQLVGADDDATEVLQAARASSLVRVVVKRPRTAPPLAEPVSATYDGKTVRYDVYVRS